MTQYQEFPLRQVGQPWPGIDTLGGRLDNGTGLLTDESTNVIINQADTLAKRKGLIRGIEQRFDTAVCGLHKYTDHCGREWLLVADNSAINIQQPFEVPVFTASDAYPSDSFTTDGAMDSATWRNTGSYIQVGGSLTRTTAANEATPRVPRGEFAYWFKDAANLSYQVQIQYNFSTTSSRVQVCGIIIKGTGSLTTTPVLQAEIEFEVGGLYQAKLWHIDANNNAELVAQLAVDGLVTAPTGFFTLSYERNTTLNEFLPSMEVVPSGGGPQTVVAPTLTQLSDMDLGQVSAIAVGKDAEIFVVSGGPV